MNEQNKGISLLNLIITIIILLIIAGIALYQLTGDKGVLSKVKLAKEKYSISQAKEKLELEILNLRIEQESKGEELKKENLPRINNDNIDVRNVEEFPVEVICEKYKFHIDENFNVTYIENTNETIVTYITDPEGYTNKDEVNILITVSNEKGIKTIEYPDGEKVICNGKTIVGIDYTVTSNGTYKFKIIDNQNKKLEKDVVIYKIDKLKPKEFIPDIETTKYGFTIKINTDDAEETNESVKSGIEFYKYYIKKIEETDDKYKEYVSKENILNITNIESQTEYSIYVSVFDRANNSISSEKITAVTENIITDIYIDTINGSDETGDGSQEYPYKNLSKITEQNIIKKQIDYNIYLLDGTYELPRDSIISLNNDRSINIIGNKQNTILKLPYNGIGANHTPGAGSTEYTLNFYKMIMTLDKNTRDNYWACQTEITFNNIVFDIKQDISLSFSIRKKF